MKSRRLFAVVALAVLAGSSAEASEAPDASAAAAGHDACSRPAQVLDLTNWKITLPVDDPAKPGPQPLDVKQPALDDYSIDPWFVVDKRCKGVLFRSAVNGVTTANSKNPRSELREMTEDGATEFRWSPVSGTHTLVIDQAITHLPNDRPHVVAGQIHDGGDDVSVFRLEGTRLYLTRGDDTHHKLITDDYRLGTRFQAKFVVTGGAARAYYNGVFQDEIPVPADGAYFKTGAYTQANCGNSAPCDESNYGQVIVYRVHVRHT
ncbi:polysaccharide lyase family 7 protein [Actinosynnema sp. NPDC050801]|uniref:polysaccharide lyase family 7 protein n=1 Tax=unclassified Actinosynnema TaxID=2637065 RepID=UPI0033E0D7AC